MTALETHKIDSQKLDSFFQFLQCQLRMEVRLCLGEDIELDRGAEGKWPLYENFVKPSSGGREKWMPYHTVLGSHELFIVQSVHQAAVPCWDACRRFMAMFIFRAHCRSELFTEVQMPFLRKESFWSDPGAHFAPNGEVTKAMLEYRKETRKPLQTQAFRAIPARVCEDDDENLVRSVTNRTQSLLEVARCIWPLVNERKLSASEMFDAISAKVRASKGLGETWAKMIMVSIDILFADIGLLAERCDVGVGASSVLRLLLPSGPSDQKDALEYLTRASNCTVTKPVRGFWKLLGKVEKMARDKFSDCPLVLRQLSTPNRKLSASTIQVQLCEWRQFRERRRQLRLQERTGKPKGKTQHPKRRFSRKRRRQTVFRGEGPPVKRKAPLNPTSLSGFRVGCLGDSCTYGTGLAPEDVYPKQLERMLRSAGVEQVSSGNAPEKRAKAVVAAEFAVKVAGFGRTGATAGEDEKSYAATPYYERALQYAADVYVIMLGTNDAWHGDPTKAELGLQNLVRDVRDKVKGCQVFLVLPPGCKEGRVASSLQSIVHPAVRKVADLEKVEVIAPELSRDRAYHKDLVHLSVEGARRVAESVAAKLLPAARAACEAEVAPIDVVVDAEVRDGTFQEWSSSLCPMTTVRQLADRWSECMRLASNVLVRFEVLIEAAEVKAGVVASPHHKPEGSFIVMDEEMRLSELWGGGASRRPTRLYLRAWPLSRAESSSARAALTSPASAVATATKSSAAPGSPANGTTKASVTNNDLPSSDARIEFKPNTKKFGTDSFCRYENYCKATTIGEALALGAQKADIRGDLQKGLCILLS